MTEQGGSLTTSGNYISALAESSVAIGQRHGLYDALVGRELTSRELSQVTALPLWFTENWLLTQSLAGYLVLDAATSRYALACPLYGTCPR